MRPSFFAHFAAMSLLFAAASVPAGAQSKWNEQYQQYINRYKDVAVEQMKKWKIPASITLAQGLLESGAGRGRLATKANNHFGIKCHGWQGRTVTHDDDERGECFRAYASAYESYEDHSRFLATSQRYSSLFRLKITDYQGWARGLKAAGYATNPRYAAQLIDIIQLYKLDRYDRQKKYDKFMVERSFDRQVSGKPLHPIKIFNKNYYIIARRGDTFRTIGQEIGISYKRIARYNERAAADPIAEGEIIWLKKKQARAPKDYKGRRHYVRSGESMYTIAQKYGIRLRALYHLNDLGPDYELRVGDELRLR